jgi:hypothetical protein
VLWPDGGGFLPLLPAVAGLAVMARILTRKPVDRCSDTECRTRIPAGAEACPGCGCRIGGWIKEKSEMYQDED